MKDKLELTADVRSVLTKINDAGYEAYVVGGFVRDALLGLKPQDLDLTTSAPPEAIMRIFADHPCYLNGIKHGTVGVLVGRRIIEITTYRQESGYHDHRHPDQVRFDTDLHGDLSRRDFTINALAYDPLKGIIDDHGGRKDLAQGLIRCIGDPIRRFDEDALRILRALRFASVYNFTIETHTAAAIHKQCDSLNMIAVERINAEFSKLLMGAGYAAMISAYPDVMAVIFREFAPSILAGELEAFLPDVGKTAEPELRLALLFGFAAPEALHSCLKRLGYSKSVIKTVSELAVNRTAVLMPDPINIRHYLRDYGPEGLARLLLYQRAAGLISEAVAGRIKDLTAKISAAGDCYSLKQLKINGADVAARITDQRRIAGILDELLTAVIEEKLPNERLALLEALDRYQ